MVFVREREDMSIRSRFFALLLLSNLLFAAPSGAQQSPSPSDKPPTAIHLDVVVTPRSGHPVAGLKQQDFTLFDNKAPQPIQSFHEVDGSQAPVEVVLLVDAVNTPLMRLSYARQQIDKFLRANGGHLAHPVSLAILTDTSTRIQGAPSTDGNALSTELDQSQIGLRSIRRSAGIYGADERVHLSLQTLHRLAQYEASRPGRKIILWVSPGWPLLSGPGIDLDSRQQRQIFSEIIGLSDALRQSRTTLYSIDPIGSGESIASNAFYYQQFVKGVARPSDVMIGDLSLQVIATQTGGLALHGNNDITAMLRQCMADSDAFYELTFDPPPAEHPSEYHHLEVRMTNPALTARTRQGYYSPQP